MKDVVRICPLCGENPKMWIETNPSTCSNCKEPSFIIQHFGFTFKEGFLLHNIEAYSVLSAIVWAETEDERQNAIAIARELIEENKEKIEEVI